METKQISCGDRLPNLSAKYQWFVAQNLEADEQIFYTMDNPLSYYRCRIPQLQGRQIKGCFHGWAILSSHPNIGTWSIWNPLTCMLIRLPPLIHEHGDSHECCLSSPPGDPSSIFLLTTTKKPTIVFCRLNCKRKKLRWTEMSYAKQLKSISGEDCFLECPTCCNGKVYALTFGRYYNFVMQIDILIKDKQVLISLLPFVEICFPSFNRCPPSNTCSASLHGLKGSGTELFYINIGVKDETMKTVGDVFLLKLDMTSLTWKVVEDIKDAVFFIELARAVYYRPEVVASRLGGYIHILGERGKVISSFHVRDGTISLSSMPSLVRESQVSVWAMLECRLDGVNADSKQDNKDDEIIVRSVKGDEIECNNTTGESESHLLNIPFHVLEMIMGLCVGVEYMNFRATCKRCYLAAPLIQWSNNTTLRRLQTYSLVSPWLMVFDKHRGIITFIDPICGDKYFIKTPQALIDDYQIYCSRYGWLLMYKLNYGPLVFFNPFTSDIRELPRVPFLGSFCFSAPPTSPDCMVVGLTTLGQWHVYIHFVAKDTSWLRLSMDVDGYDRYSFLFPTFYGRHIYALHDKEGGIDVFTDMDREDDFEEPMFVAKAPSSSCTSPRHYFLANCDQHLLLVVMGVFGESIEVFNLNDSKGEWEKIDNLGKHMIYISDTTCLCVEAKLPEMENKIYFPRLLDNSEKEKIVLYSLDTCRYCSFNGKNLEESFGGLYGTKQHLYPHTWIEPSWS